MWIWTTGDARSWITDKGHYPWIKGEQLCLMADRYSLALRRLFNPPAYWKDGSVFLCGGWLPNWWGHPIRRMEMRVIHLKQDGIFSRWCVQLHPGNKFWFKQCTDSSGRPACCTRLWLLSAASWTLQNHDKGMFAMRATDMHKWRTKGGGELAYSLIILSLPREDYKNFDLWDPVQSGADTLQARLSGLDV